jgi:hypothetical protein
LVRNPSSHHAGVQSGAQIQADRGWGVRMSADATSSSFLA